MDFTGLALGNLTLDEHVQGVESWEIDVRLDSVGRPREIVLQEIYDRVQRVRGARHVRDAAGPHDSIRFDRMMPRRGLELVSLLFASGALCASASCTLWPGETGAPPRQERGVGETGAVYVDSVTCNECHQAEYDAWSNSHHDLAMQRATPRTVLGDFDNTTLTHFGVTSRFFTRNGRFYVNTEGPDGKRAEFELTYVFGVEPLQQYLAPFPGGRLQSLTIAWDTQRNEWFQLYPDERIRPEDPLHWTGRYQNWNAMCAECHSTNLRKNYDPATDTYQTVWDEIDVGCQACHGPGGSHVDWARSVGGDASESDSATDVGLVVDLATASSVDEIEACAGCHSRRQRINDVDRHARPLLDDFRPSTLRTGLYHPDGQIQNEVYVWGSFVQSKMHEAGVRCSTCHDPHELDLTAEGNAVCTQCHGEMSVKGFPTLELKRYDTTEHHFHLEDSDGAQCVSCHMPMRTYMEVDPRRDHSFRVPRPDISAELGTPNACTMCHTDRDAAWAAAHFENWWESPDTPNFAGVFAAARAADPAAEVPLLDLVTNTAQPAIVRATALEHLRQYGPETLELIASAATDAHPLVRVAAVGGLEGLLPPRRRIETVEALLDDPVRAVRIEAARVLASVPIEDLSRPQAERLKAALAEFVEAEMVSADMPEARLNLGVLRQRAGQTGQAEREYMTALRLDPGFTPVRFNLANLYNQQGRNEEAEAILRDGIEQEPEEGELHYSLALLLAEENRLEQAADSFEQATELIPRARIRYNYGLVLQQLGRLDEAEAALVEANVGNPRDSDVLLALTQLLMDRGDLERARQTARALLQLNPTEPGTQQLLNEIQLRQVRQRR